MGEGPKRPATYEDLLALPEHVVGQIVDGELIVMPRPASPHAKANSGLYGELYGPFERGRGGPGGWWFLVEPELHFRKDVLVPDLAAWRRERMPEIPDVPYFTLAPDWVCEVLSPSTAPLDRVKKKRIYAREGVGHVWLVDPKARTLEVFRRDGARWVELGTYSGDERVRAEPFEALELALGDLWLTAEVKPGSP
ncbi:Uma2 family endonuclease [Myxococcus sp. MISCRS1]|uniref:Uma2 family endonuclease n=1 Tax=Myxococcus TaxID=32 RepID=UPI0011447A05|nr:MULTISPECIES: Uma2 family endonuclease [unclassified Myxococcus]MBZ4412005.1 Uma2 family endonuclease [Myxococcus sp. XM-1-1-1]MCY0999104.1 Uma2 family endonuclease [Myxococcus sp. MISCRS1]BDT30890.1 Uma2 family endonuclease [Myxococcus sp. MH1]